MTTASDLISSAEDFLLGATSDEVNVLTSSITNSDTTLTFTYDLGGIVAGAVLCVDIEVMRVMAVNQTTNTATVLRARRGSTAASHSASSVVQVAPRFSRWSVFRAINDDLDALSGEGLFQMKTVDLTFNSSIMGYDLTSVSSIEQVYSVRYEVPGPSKEWPRLERKDWRYDPSASTTDFASGNALIIYNGAYSGRGIRVAYKAPFARLSALTDDVQTVTGLPATANDIPPLGAAMKLIAGHESGRIAYESQPDTRRPDEVPVTANLNASTGWARLRQSRIDKELARLQKKYPVTR